MTMKLRSYQEEGIQKLRESLRRSRATIYQLPTGGGKTVVMGRMADGAARKGKRTIFLVHRRELWSQASRTFDQMGIAHGIIAPGMTMTRDLVQVGSVQTVIKRLDRIPVPDLVIVDEAHHSPAGTWSTILKAWSASKIVGLTATPCRLDGRGLDDIFDALVLGPTPGTLIEQGFLAPYQVYAPPIGIDVSAVKSRGGDFAKDQAAREIDKPTITGDAVRHYQRIAPGRRAIVFCCSIDHSKHVVAQFQSAGVRAEHLDGNEDDHRRRRVVEAFGRGDIKILSSCELFTEGFDVPGADVAILLRPTQSLGMYLQMVGRVLRPQPGKTAVILDHAGNVLRHGLPDDEREWTLEGRRKGEKRATEPSIRVDQCPECFACHAPAPACPACGAVYEAQGREIREQDGELQQVDPAELRRQRNREQARAETLEELIELGKSRGYGNPAAWAKHILQARRRRTGERRAA